MADPDPAGSSSRSDSIANGEQPSFLMKSWLGAIVFLAGVVAMAWSARYSLTTGEGEWFQRSGSLAVLCSAILEIQQSAKKRQKEGTHVKINDREVFVDIPVSTITKILHVFAWIGILAGTAVWGYGDLLF